MLEHRMQIGKAVPQDGISGIEIAIPWEKIANIQAQAKIPYTWHLLGRQTGHKRLLLAGSECTQPTWYVIPTLHPGEGGGEKHLWV